MKKTLSIAASLAGVAGMVAETEWEDAGASSPTLIELLGLAASKGSPRVATTDMTQSRDSAPTHDTPNQGQNCTAAAAALQKQAIKMRKKVAAVAEQDLPVGAVVIVPINKVDHSKVCPTWLPCIVIEKVHDKYQVAYRTDILANCLARQGFIHEPNKTPVFYELDEALANWKFFRVISIQTGSTANSMVGGQGHVHCNCSGECNSRQCKCRKAGVSPQKL